MSPIFNQEPEKDDQNYKLNEIPQEILCGITGKIMSDPVVAQDGFSYERANILEWFKNQKTSPTT